MDTMKLSIVTPSGEIFNGDIKSVSLPGKEGEFGVLPGHSSVVASLTVGVIEVDKVDSGIEAIAINWGHVKVCAKAIDILVDGAVSLCASDCDISTKIKEAEKLVNSVKDVNVSMASVNSKIKSFA